MDSFKLIRFIGSGSFGQVVMAKSKETGKVFAIKLIKNVFSKPYHCKKVLREISILRRLSKLKSNVYTTKLYDIIIPCQKPGDIETFTEVFLVMDYVEFDLKNIF